jgi:hypothetical protein
LRYPIWWKRWNNRALILQELREIKNMEVRIMAALDDLAAVVIRIQAAVNDAVVDIKALADQVLQAHGIDDSAAIETAVDKLNALADTLEAAAKPAEPAAP